MKSRAKLYLDQVPGPARGVLRRLVAGELSPPVALAGLLFAFGSAAEVEDLLVPLAQAHPRFAAITELLRRNPEGLNRIVPLLPDHPEEEGTGEVAIEACRRFFDRAVARSEEASVALYSLGDPELLAEGTREVFDLLDRWGLLISEGMLAVAKRRAQGLDNVHFVLVTGRDLSPFPAGRFDLVFAVDSFPYLQQAGPELVATHFAEAARVLTPGGDFAVLNFSYSGDLQSDRDAFADLCSRCGFLVEVPGIQPFTLWDGSAFLARLRLRRGPRHLPASAKP